MTTTTKRRLRERYDRLDMAGSRQQARKKEDLIGYKSQNALHIEREEVEKEYIIQSEKNKHKNEKKM